jgi:hypothetical protein
MGIVLPLFSCANAWSSKVALSLPSKGGVEPNHFFVTEIDTQLEISHRLNFISSQLHLEFLNSDSKF